MLAPKLQGNIRFIFKMEEKETNIGERNGSIQTCGITGNIHRPHLHVPIHTLEDKSRNVF